MPDPIISPEEQALKDFIARTGGYNSMPLYNRIPMPATGGGGGGTGGGGGLPGSMPQMTPEESYAWRSNFRISPAAQQYAQQYADVQNTGGIQLTGDSPAPQSLVPLPQYAGTAYGNNGMVGYGMSPAAADAQRNLLGNIAAQATQQGRTEQGFVNIGTAANPYLVSWGNFVRGYDDNGNLLSEGGAGFRPVSGGGVQNQFEAGPDFLRVQGMGGLGPRPEVSRAEGTVFDLPGAVTARPGGQLDAALLGGDIQMRQQRYTPGAAGYVPYREIPGLVEDLDPGKFNPDSQTLGNGQWSLVTANIDMDMAALQAANLVAYDPVTGQKLTTIKAGQRVVIEKGSEIQPALNGFLLGAAGNINDMTPAERTAYSNTDEGRAAMTALINAGYGFDAQGNVTAPDGTQPSQKTSGGGIPGPAAAPTDESLPAGYSYRADGKIDDGIGHYWDPGDGKWYNNDGSLYTEQKKEDPVPQGAATLQPAAGPVPGPVTQPSQPSFSSVDSGRYQDPRSNPTSREEIISKTGVDGLKPGQQTSFFKYEGTGELDPYMFKGYIVYYQPKGSTSKYRAKPGTVIYPGDKVSLEKLKPGHVFSYEQGVITDEATNEVVEQYAFGGTTGDDRLIVGDPQVPGKPNPEMVHIDWENRQAHVTPMNHMGGGAPQYAFGGLFPPGGSNWVPPTNGGPLGSGGVFNPQNNWQVDWNAVLERLRNSGGTNTGGGGEGTGGGGGGTNTGGGGTSGGGTPGAMRVPGPINMGLLRWSPIIREQFFRDRDNAAGIPVGSSAAEFDFFRLRGADQPGRVGM